MTLSNKETLKKKGLNILDIKDNIRGVQIYKLLFSNWHTRLEVCKVIYPNLYDRSGKTWNKNKIHRAVSDYITVFDQLKWLEKREKKQNFPGKDPIEYRAKLNPYFDYLKEVKNINLSSQQERYIENIVYDWRGLALVSLDKGSFFTIIDSLIKEGLLLNIEHSLSGKLTEFKKSSNLYKSIELMVILSDKFTLELFKELLKWKYILGGIGKEMNEKEAKLFFKNILEPVEFGIKNTPFFK